ncbi:uncharacterized protein LOC112050982 [Bicyclus anynana]|uniref:Odorant receptor n=1 Tax=Bicyclus anynana TaxID=110368 RepID=A0ABM3LNT6_BICAN|nr:uncharacterized protein LOC112050982 [Bicyclus anynana]
MHFSTKNYDSKKTSQYFYKAGRILAIGGLPGYVKWCESGYTRPVYKHIQSFLTVCVVSFVVMEVGAFFTQTNLTERQQTDLLVLGFCHPILMTYPFILTYHRERIRNLLYRLCVTLKKVYNDVEVERRMTRSATLYSISIVLNIYSALISYGYEEMLHVIRTGEYLFVKNSSVIVEEDGTFMPVITAWPDVKDESNLAHISRIACYLIWWVCMTRICAAFYLIIIITGCLCFQYTNLQSYFYSLNDIFEQAGETDRENAEHKYEEAFKVGIQLHAETLWCTRQCQVICSIVYSLQIVLNVATFSVLMLQMTNSERTLASTIKTVVSCAALLCTTGMSMWNAGNVTIEATHLPTAMYCSGWHLCRGRSSLRVRKLLVVAMIQAQRHVVIHGFGIMEISYRAYVTMVKTSYSVFSLLY